MNRSNKNLAMIVLIMFAQMIGLAFITPVLPEIAKYLNIAPGKIFLYFILGQALGQLAFGYWSDVLGRKTLLITGVFLFSISSFLITLSNNEAVILSLRFLQGFSVSAFYAITTAIIADQSSSEKMMVSGISISDLGFGIAWFVLPFTGSLVAYFGAWKINFYIMSIFVLIVGILCVFFIKETRYEANRTSIKNTTISFIRMIKPSYIIIPIIMGLPNSFFFIFNSTAPIILQKTLFHSSLYIGIITSIIGSAYIMINIINITILKNINTKLILSMMSLLFFITSLTQFILAKKQILNSFTLYVPMIINFMIWGVIFPHISKEGLKRYPKNYGNTTSFMGFIFYITTIVLMKIFNKFFINNFYNITVFTLIIATFSILCFIYLFIADKNIVIEEKK